MSKKIVLAIFAVLVILVAGGGAFWWWQGKEIKGSPEDYVVKETPEGKFVENKKAGLTVKVPEGWEAERVEIDEGAFDFISPEFEAERKDGKITLPLKRGCKIQSSVGYSEDKELTFTDLKLELRYSLALAGMKSISFEETSINSHQALKTIFDQQEEGVGIGMSISIPMGNKVYGFSAMWASDAKDNCIQEFDKFLETVSFK